MVWGRGSDVQLSYEIAHIGANDKLKVLTQGPLCFTPRILHPLFLTRLRLTEVQLKEHLHNVETLGICSFAHHVCSPLLQGSRKEEELWKGALTRYFALDVICVCQD